MMCIRDSRENPSAYFVSVTKFVRYVRTARGGFPVKFTISNLEDLEALLDFADFVRQNKEELAKLLTGENGRVRFFRVVQQRAEPRERVVIEL